MWCIDVSLPISGPPLVMEVHDRDSRLGDPSLPSLFGREERDEVLGTCAFGTGNIAQQVELAYAPDGNGGGLGTALHVFLQIYGYMYVY